MLSGNLRERSNKIADGAAGNTSLDTPENSGVSTSLRSPCRIQCLIVCAIVCDEDASLLGRILQLLGVGDLPVRTANLMHRECIDASLAQALGHPIAQIFVE